jgi:outer membrane immunogenic protein
MTRRFIYAFALVGALISPALAADLYTKAPIPPPLPAPPPNWSGIYTGVEGGYGWSQDKFENTFNSFDIGSGANVLNVLNAPGGTPVTLFPAFAGPGVGPFDNINQNGWLFGGFVGAQKQWGSWVIGLEADYDWADIKGSANSSGTETGVPVSTFEWQSGVVSCGLGAPLCLKKRIDFADISRSVSIDTKIDELGSVRGKGGYAFWQNWMIYGTGGLAWAHSTTSVSGTETLNFTEPLALVTIPTIPFPSSPQTRSVSATGGQTMLGWAAGAGLDYKVQVDQGSAWIFGVEYLHYQFPKDTISLSDNNISANLVSSTQSVDAIKGRISYLFSIH